MDSKHINREHSAHRQSVIRPYDEYTKLEIFSFDPQYTRTYIGENNTLSAKKNAVKVPYKAWTCFQSADKLNEMVFDIDYFVKDDGEYRIDLIYEQSDHMFEEVIEKASQKPKHTTTVKSLLAEELLEKANSIADKLELTPALADEMADELAELVRNYLSSKPKTIKKTTNSSEDKTGHIKVSNGDIVVFDEDRLFDGENNILKRTPVFLPLTKGNHTIRISVPHNCYFMGVIIRKTIHLVGDNYYGDSVGSEEGDLVVTSCTISNSDMTKPVELQASIFYDDSLVCDESPSGFYIDYMDEMNFYVKDDDGQIKQIFGGYVSSILPNSDFTTLTIHGADRLEDGVNKYILDEMKMLGGTNDSSTDEYVDSMTKDFENYPQALQYLCDIHEITLKSNISNDWTVDGELFHNGLSVTYGKKKKIKKIPVSNGISSPSDNYILLRNKASSANEQIFNIYDAKKHSKAPPELSPYMHIVYGLGKPKKEYDTKTTETVDNAETTAGSQNFTKCGVSKDKKYVMGIGQRGVGRDKSNYPYGSYFKSIFENKCPYCGKDTLRWDSCRTGSDCIRGGTKKDFPVPSNETEITCENCDCDFDVPTGYSKEGHYKYKLKKVTTTVKSSKSEQDKLHAGKMVAVAKTGVELTPDDIFKAITKEAFKYKYKRNGSGQTYSSMKKVGYGDCHGFSDLISTMLKKYKVNHKIVRYRTNASDEHRSVMYMNDKKEWVDFPYREYGWDTKYNNMLNNTSASKTARAYDTYKSGTTIGKATVSSTNTTKEQTTTVKNTKGYDKDKPFQAYIKLIYSKKPSFKAKKKSVYIKYTYNAPVNVPSINTDAFAVYWINSTIKRATLQTNLLEFLNEVEYGDQEAGNPFYIQGIQFIAPKVESTSDNKDVDWYKEDKTTNDNSSCKMRLYQIFFDDNRGADANELKSCGKSINSMLKQLVDDAGYYVDIDYKTHRCDDIINFRVLDTSSESFIATEGDSNNILAWNSISYSPVSSMFNQAIQVFKNNNQYYYINTRDPQSILNYGEQTTLSTANEEMSEKEAYFKAVNNENINPNQTYTYTITVPNYPNLRIGDYVKVVANAKKLNTIKEVKSIKVIFDTSKMPRVQTELGLDELSPDLQLRQNIRAMRKTAKEESNTFTSTAKPITDEMYYEWDR